MFSEQQIYLLKSALLSPVEAHTFWERWKSMNPYPTSDIGKLRLEIFDRLDPECQKLLALIYRNLKDFAASDPYLQAIKSNIRYNWFRNERLWFSFAQLTRSLNERGITPVLFKGGATSLLYYPDKSTRFLADLDLFFPEHADTAVRELILARGGRDVYYFSEKYSPLIFHAAQYSTEDKDDFDVHRYFLHEHLYPEANVNLLKGQTTHELEGGGYISLLSPTVQLFLSLVHGTRSEHRSKVLWAVDAWYILKKDAERIDWNELAELSIYFKYSSLIKNTLSTLVNFFGIVVPTTFLDRLRAIREEQMLHAYLENRDKRERKLLPEMLRSMRACVQIYRFFLKSRVSYSLVRWLFFNYAYRSERLIKRL